MAYIWPGRGSPAKDTMCQANPSASECGLLVTRRLQPFLRSSERWAPSGGRTSLRRGTEPGTLPFLLGGGAVWHEMEPQLGVCQSKARVYSRFTPYVAPASVSSSVKWVNNRTRLPGLL